VLRAWKIVAGKQGDIEMSPALRGFVPINISPMHGVDRVRKREGKGSIAEKCGAMGRLLRMSFRPLA
jgi:hypothetical protein